MKKKKYRLEKKYLSIFCPHILSFFEFNYSLDKYIYIYIYIYIFEKKIEKKRRSLKVAQHHWTEWYHF